jgi:hypothetical protein
VEWLTDEDFVVARIMAHLQLRKERVKNEKRLHLAVTWFDEYLEHADKLRAKLDAMQETVLTEEMRRISKCAVCVCVCACPVRAWCVDPHKFCNEVM